MSTVYVHVLISLAAFFAAAFFKLYVRKGRATLTIAESMELSMPLRGSVAHGSDENDLQKADDSNHRKLNTEKLFMGAKGLSKLMWFGLLRHPQSRHSPARSDYWS